MSTQKVNRSLLTPKEAPVNFMIVFNRSHLLIRRVYYSQGAEPFSNFQEEIFITKIDGLLGVCMCA